MAKFLRETEMRIANHRHWVREREERFRELQNQPEPLTNQQQTDAAEVDRNDFFRIDRHYQAVLTMIRENAA